QSDLESERLRSQLQTAALEHEVRFSRLHERRANVIAETYALLKAVFDRLSNYVAPFEPVGGPSRQERFTALVDAHNSFRSYYSGRLIFLPQGVASQLEKADGELVRAGAEFRHF